MKISRCVQCGYCCTVSPCAYGIWDHTKKQCQFLNPDSTCARYAYVVEHEKDSPFPMMGCGCSSSFCNERRDAKMRAMGIDPSIEQNEILKSLGINLDFSPDFDKLWEK
jgi:hypothetical protein